MRLIEPIYADESVGENNNNKKKFIGAHRQDRPYQRRTMDLVAHLPSPKHATHR